MIDSAHKLIESLWLMTSVSSAISKHPDNKFKFCPLF